MCPFVTVTRRAALFLPLFALLSCTLVHPLKRLQNWWVFKEPGFSMRPPPEGKGGPVQGIDSSVGEFASGYLELTYDYGMWGTSFEEQLRREDSLWPLLRYQPVRNAREREGRGR